jgi:hypothetical protein
MSSAPRADRQGRLINANARLWSRPAYPQYGNRRHGVSALSRGRSIDLNQCNSTGHPPQWPSEGTSAVTQTEYRALSRVAKQNVAERVTMKRMWTVKIGMTIAGALLGSLVYFASDAQFDALMAPATRDAIYFVLFVLWVAAIIMLGMIGENLDAAIHRKDGA